MANERSSLDLPDSALLTPREVCDMLRISASTLSNWARDGVITSVPLPSGHRRYRRDEVEAIARGEVPA